MVYGHRYVIDYQVFDPIGFMEPVMLRPVNFATNMGFKNLSGTRWSNKKKSYCGINNQMQFQR